MPGRRGDQGAAGKLPHGNCAEDLPLPSGCEEFGRRPCDEELGPRGGVRRKMQNELGQAPCGSGIRVALHGEFGPARLPGNKDEPPSILKLVSPEESEGRGNPRPDS